VKPLKHSENTPENGARFLSIYVSYAGDSLFHFPRRRHGMWGSCRTLSIAIPVCPACGVVTSVAGFRRFSAVVDYYLCKRCGHIWAVHKNDPTIIDHFKPLPKKPG